MWVVGERDASLRTAPRNRELEGEHNERKLGRSYERKFGSRPAHASLGDGAGGAFPHVYACTSVSSFSTFMFHDFCMGNF